MLRIKGKKYEDLVLELTQNTITGVVFLCVADSGDVIVSLNPKNRQLEIWCNLGEDVEEYFDLDSEGRIKYEEI